MAAFGEVILILSPMFRQGPTGIYVLVDDEVGIKSLLVSHIFCVLIMSFCVHFNWLVFFFLLLLKEPNFKQF